MEFSQNLITIFDELCKKIGIAIDWTAENIMPYIKELFERFIKFEIGTSIFYIILSLVVCVIFYIASLASYRAAKNREWDEDYFISWFNVVAIGASIILSLIAIVVIGNQIYDIIQAIYLPEKTLYDFIMTQRVTY